MPTSGKCSLVPMKESFSKHLCAVFHRGLHWLWC